MRECDVLEERGVKARLQRHPGACSIQCGLRFSWERRRVYACGLAWAEPHTWKGQMGEATGIKNSQAQASG